MSMNSWKSKILHAGKGSQTPGKQKGESCQADFRKRFFASRSRSYKDPKYGEWCASMDSLNGNTKRSG